MYKLVNLVTSTMIGASAVIVLGVVVYSSVLAINGANAPRGDVQISEIAQSEVPALAEAGPDSPAPIRR